MKLIPLVEEIVQRKETFSNKAYKLIRGVTKSADHDRSALFFISTLYSKMRHHSGIIDLQAYAQVANRTIAILNLVQEWCIL